MWIKQRIKSIIQYRDCIRLHFRLVTVFFHETRTEGLYNILTVPFDAHARAPVLDQDTARGSLRSIVPPITSYPVPLFSLPHSVPSVGKTVNPSIFFMSSTGPAMLTSSTSTIPSIIDAALADYTKLTGTDLSKTPFATALEQSNSIQAVLQLLHEREKAFKEYRDDDRKLLNCLGPAVKVLQAFSDIVGEAVSQVSHKCHPATLF
jgi:hypothetical protein